MALTPEQKAIRLGEDRLELGPAFADQTIEIYDYKPIGDL